MLQSERQFGIELEFLTDSTSVLDRIMANGVNVVQDGSLRPNTGGEYVSPPLTGKSGEEEIARVCRILKSQGVNVQHPSTSLHLHLDGRRRNRDVKMARTKINKPGKQLAISRSVLDTVPEEDVVASLVNYGSFDLYGLNKSEFDGVIYISRARLSRKPRINYVYFLLEEEERIPWLTRMFYFYTQYSGVLSSLVSHSRSIGNMYCQQLSNSFTLEEIEEIEGEDDFIRVWYKGFGIGGHYCDSRYHNVNFHSYFDRHGTVEIRCHGATVDPNKIMLWVRLHQYIADKLEHCNLEDIKIDMPNKMSWKTPDNVYLEFIKFLEDDPVLVEYVKRLLGYFSGISIVKDKVKRK